MKAILVIAVMSVLVSSVLCDHWALLVAASSSWSNYRHQADICHAYHILHDHGIPDERIVVMMYDDIAHNAQNPYPGNIINQPDGRNLYPGVPKDYTGMDITADVFLKVLMGDEKGIEKVLGRKGKVIKSGPNDHVFVNFADHGGPGALHFQEESLYADQLNEAILLMHKHKQYKEMVFYVEACESGSIFDGILRSDINVYVTTSANPTESSFGCYYDKVRKTLLGDVYSVNWMQDSDVENLKTETLFQQFQIVKKKTNTSHVMQYGELSMNNQTLDAFQGGKTSKFHKHNYKFVNPLIDAIPSEDVEMEILRRREESAHGPEKIQLEEALKTLQENNMEVMRFFQKIVNFVSDSEDYYKLLKTKVHFSDFTCYRKSIDIIRTDCRGMNLSQNGHALRNLRVLANLCETDVPMQTLWSVIVDVSRNSRVCMRQNPIV